jgi:hypothetical protein
MSALVNQLVTVVVLIGATVITATRVGVVEFRIGSHLNLNRVDSPDPKDARTNAYLELKLSAVEENNMLAWNLFPQRFNKRWWQKYRILSGKTDEDGAPQMLARADTV